MPSEPTLPPITTAGVVASLQVGVRLHLTAIENYAAQAAHFGRWGYSKLAAKYAADAEEERGHLKSLLERLEYYDVQPDCAHDQPMWPRHDFEGVLAANYELETATAAAERAGVLACRAVGDERSALVFASNLEGSEDSIADIEATQRVLEQIGLDNYLANQV
jgi:bacterioferritin (cytochrome b1)